MARHRTTEGADDDNRARRRRRRRRGLGGSSMRSGSRRRSSERRRLLLPAVVLLAAAIAMSTIATAAAAASRPIAVRPAASAAASFAAFAPPAAKGRRRCRRRPAGSGVDAPAAPSVSVVRGRTRGLATATAAASASAVRFSSSALGSTFRDSVASSSSSSGVSRPERGSSKRRSAAAVASAGGGWASIDWDAVDLRARSRSPKGAVEGGADEEEEGENRGFEDDDDDDGGIYSVSSVDALHRPAFSPDAPSPVELCLIRDRMAYVKRDDLLRLRGSNVSGNKARKFLALNELPAEDFPDCVVSHGGPQSNAMLALAAIVNSKNVELRGEEEEGGGGSRSPTIDEFMEELGPRFESGMEFEADMTREESASVLSAGPSPDADADADDVNGENSAPVQKKNPRKIRFVYYTKTLPRYLRKQPSGNLLRALSLGVELVELPPPEYLRLFGGLHGGSVHPPADLEPPPTRGGEGSKGSLWIPQGGACAAAVPGAKLLAAEIVEFWSRNGRGLPLSVCLPGGTCSTGLLLHREVRRLSERVRGKDGGRLDIRVVVVPCVGDDSYALRQMKSLDRATGGSGRDEDMPSILRPLPDSDYGAARRRTGGYFVFGEPAAAVLQSFEEMRDEHGVFLDLLYGAPAWSLMLQHWRTTRGDVGHGHHGRAYVGGDCPIAGRQVMYVHSGGLEGVSSQLTRYKHKGLIDARSVQP